MTTYSSEKYCIGGLLSGVVGLAFGILLDSHSPQEMCEIIRDEVEAQSQRAADLLNEKKATTLNEGLVNVSSELEKKEKPPRII